MRYKFFGDDIILCLLLILCMVIPFYCIFAVLSPSCLPFEHTLSLPNDPRSDYYCPDCGELLRDVVFCGCGARLTGDYCSACGTLRGGN